MHGIGVMHYADGSVYDGLWRRGRRHGVGIFRPSGVCCAVLYFGEMHVA